MSARPSSTSTRRRGFTLVELVIAVVILAVIATIAIPKFITSVNGAALARDTTSLGSLANDATSIARTTGAELPIGSDVVSAATEMGTLPGTTTWSTVVSTSAVAGPSTHYGQASYDATDSSTSVGYAMVSQNGDCSMALSTASSTTTWSYATALGAHCDGSFALAGSGQPQLDYATVITAPDAPTALIGTSYQASAVPLTWTYPASGGSAIDYYQTRYSTDALTWSPWVSTGSSTSSYVVTGLTNGTAYYFEARAHNAVGLSAPSTSSPQYTPGATPSTPTGVSGSSTGVVSWTAPATGGSPIDFYRVSYSTDGVTWTVATSTATSSPYSVTGLSTGTSYFFEVAAHNASGWGSSGATGSSALLATAPFAPTAVTATSGQNAQSSVSWTTPSSNGGSTITSYAVQYSSDGGTTWTVATVSAAASPYVVTGLVNGTSYIFEVAAINSVGAGAYSTASSSAVPAPTVVATIAVGSLPYAVSSDGTHVWVANYGANTVSEILASSGAVVATIAVGAYPVAISSDGVHVWVANDGANTVSEIVASTGVVLHTIAVGSGPSAISSDGTHVWVANNGANTVSEILASSGAVVALFTVGTSPVAVSSDGTHVWVANNGSSTVSELLASSGATVAVIALGSGPAAITSDGTHVWVASPGANTVSEILASTHVVVATIAVGTNPNSVSSDGTHVWVANYGANTVSEILVSSGAVVATIAVGTHPIVISFDGTHVWVANNSGNTVSEILP